MLPARVRPSAVPPDDGARLPRPGEEVQGDAAVHDVRGARPERRIDAIRNGTFLDFWSSRLVCGWPGRHRGTAPASYYVVLQTLLMPAPAIEATLDLPS